MLQMDTLLIPIMEGGALFPYSNASFPYYHNKGELQPYLFIRQQKEVDSDPSISSRKIGWLEFPAIKAAMIPEVVL